MRLQLRLALGSRAVEAIPGLALGALAALLVAIAPVAAEDSKSLTTEESLKKDQAAAIRFLTLNLDRERELVKRGSEAEAVKLEDECLRQEAKCLERCLWYVRHDSKLKGKARALSSALDRIKGTDPKAGLADRKKSGFKISGAVSDPLGVQEDPKGPRMESHGSTFNVGSVNSVMNKPDRAVNLDPTANRFDSQVRPPPGAETP